MCNPHKAKSNETLFTNDAVKPHTSKNVDLSAGSSQRTFICPMLSFSSPCIGSSKSLVEKNVIFFLAGLNESNFDMMTIAPDLLPRHISFGDPRETTEAHVRTVVKTFEPGVSATSPAEYSLLLLDVFRHRSEEHTSELQSLIRISY